QDDGVPRYTLIASDGRADFSGMITDPNTGNVQAVSFEFAREEWQILDTAIAADWNFLRSVTDGEISITSRTRRDNLWTVAYVRDDGPVEYYLYDRAAKNATYLFSNR